jgi:predicted aspartyl protease
MDKLMTSKLPPEQQRLLHDDFVANELAYWRIRDDLLAGYPGQWVAVRDGRVIASGPDLMEVLQTAAADGGHPFIARVGEEEIPFRVRRAEFAYDQSYQPVPIPRASVTFWDHAEANSQTYHDAILDTGADHSVLPTADCVTFDLLRSPYYTAVSSGIVGAGITTLIYLGRGEIDGRRVPAMIQPVDGGQERIVGREVLNQHCITFDGPAGRVVFGA